MLAMEMGKSCHLETSGNKCKYSTSGFMLDLPVLVSIVTGAVAAGKSLWDPWWVPCSFRSRILFFRQDEVFHSGASQGTYNSIAW